MKLLYAFALFAVAFADEIRVVPLPPSPLFSRVSMGQVIIPNYVIDAIKVGMPVMRHEAVVADDGLKVHFVDAPLDVADFETVQVFDAPEPVRLGDAPAPAFETADSDSYAVRFVDAPLEVAPVAEEIAFEAVRIAELSLPEFAPEPVLIAEAAEAAVPAFETVDVEAVRIAEPSLPLVAPVAEEIAPEPVLIAESADVDAARFDDAHVADVIAVEPVRIAEPKLPEVAAVAEEIAPEPVQIAEAPLPAFEAPVADAVRFVVAPLDVEAVKIAVPQYGDYRVKQFDDPRLR